MNEKVSRHLAKIGVFRTRLPEEDTFTYNAPVFLKWFHRNVMGFDSEEYRREFWREANRHGRMIGEMPYGLKEYMHRRTPGVGGDVFFNMLCYCIQMGGAFAIWLIRREIDKYLGRLRRPMYYDAERKRRVALAKERRRIRVRSTLNPCPSPDALREAYAHRKESHEAALRLGSLLEDVECYVDNSALIVGDSIIGRRPGVKGWLHDNAQDLYIHYKRLMHYKMLSKRFRQVVGLSDPIPTTEVLSQQTSVICASTQNGNTSETDVQDFTSDETFRTARKRELVLQDFDSDESGNRGEGHLMDEDRSKKVVCSKNVARFKNATRSGNTPPLDSQGCSRNAEHLENVEHLGNVEHLRNAKKKAEKLILAAKEDGMALIALETQMARWLVPEFSPLSKEHERKQEQLMRMFKAG